MTIQVTEIKTNAVAIKVLSYFKAIAIGEHENVAAREGFMTVEYYMNGRERGFAIRPELFTVPSPDRKVAFSECRNSNQIVVYFGRIEDFANETNMPSRDVYLKAKYLEPHQAASAAEFIYNYLMRG